MRINSPFDNKAEGSIIKKIPTSEIISGYLFNYNIDVSYLFKNTPYIFLCLCPITKLKFFYPPNLDGDENFYKLISRNNWYYKQERWEHLKAIKFIKQKQHVLEIGSGAGSFLKLLTNQLDVSYCGLELNQAAIELALNDSIVLTNELLETHSYQNNEIYDIVCSFQVYEHISKIHELFTDSLKVLKSNGLLIVSVPNNDIGFIKNNHSASKYLNMPPHHVNLFTEESLILIGKFYNLKIKEIIKEPIQKMHTDVYLHELFLRLFFGSTFLLRAFWKLKLHIPFRYFVRLMHNKINGHTIIAVFEK